MTDREQPTQGEAVFGHRMQIPGPKIIKLFSSSAQLSMKFQLLITFNVAIVQIGGKFRFKTQKLVIFPAHKC